MNTTTSTLNNLSFFSRIRRNHGLEHATLHVLSEAHPRQSMAGYSDWRGFWILGEVSLEDVRAAVQTAHERLQNGESNLVLHANCGTNYVVSGTLAGIGAVLGLFGVGPRKRDWLERLPLAASLATMALIIAQPLGYLVQARLTTSPEIGDMQVVEILAEQRGVISAYRVLTQG